MCGSPFIYYTQLVHLCCTFSLVIQSEPQQGANPCPLGVQPHQCWAHVKIHFASDSESFNGCYQSQSSLTQSSLVSFSSRA